MNLFKPLNRGLVIAGLGISLPGFGGEQAAEASIRNRVRGIVSVMGKPVADASVTLWTTRGGQEPEQAKVVRSKKDGSFAVSVISESNTPLTMAAMATPLRRTACRWDFAGCLIKELRG